MSWADDEAALIDANRNALFPPLQDPNDNGTLNTRFYIEVPYRVHPKRRRELLDTLQQWATDQGLDTFLDPGQLTFVASDISKEN